MFMFFVLSRESLSLTKVVCADMGLELSIGVWKLLRVYTTEGMTASVPEFISS